MVQVAVGAVMVVVITRRHVALAELATGVMIIVVAVM
jgi:hypothetical protein